MEKEKKEKKRLDYDLCILKHKGLYENIMAVVGKKKREDCIFYLFAKWKAGPDLFFFFFLIQIQTNSLLR